MGYNPLPRCFRWPYARGRDLSVRMRQAGRAGSHMPITTISPVLPERSGRAMSVVRLGHGSCCQYK